MEFILEEDIDSSYVPRTEINAKEADVTFAIAIKFDSAGEKLTKSMALKHGKLYIPVAPSGDIKLKSDKIVELINKTFKTKGIGIITFNIAGNGICTMKGVMTQEQCDDFTYELLHSIIKHPNLGVKVKSIRSGGQTGFDESGIKAGLKLGLDTTAYYPKGFRIRDMVSDRTQTREDIFKTFRINHKGQLVKEKMFVDMDNVLCDFVKSYLEWKQEHPEITYPQSQFGFFSNLSPVEGAIEAFNKLDSKFDVYILTRPSVYNLMCYTEKADWVKRHLGFQFLEKLIIMCDKSMVKAEGAYLIDDDTQAGQLEFEGEFIHFKTDKFPSWEVTLKYLGL